jgi:FkbM family methyltransferase
MDTLRFRARAKRMFDALPPSLRSGVRIGMGLWSRGRWSDVAGGARLALANKETTADIVADMAAGDPAAAIALTSERLLTYGYYARLGDILRRLDISLALDCGAHEGYFGSQICGYARFGGDLVSFEPVARFHAALAARAAAFPNWHTVNAAIGEMDGAGVIHVGGGHGGTSSMLPAADALAEYAPDATFKGDEPIRVVRLDTFLSDDLQRLTKGRGGKSVRIFLKLDVQGAEAIALRSLGTYVDETALIQIELAGVEFYQGQTGFGDLCKMVCDKGFSPILVHNNFGAGNVTFFDFDVLFCRQDLVRQVSA